MNLKKLLGKNKEDRDASTVQILAFIVVPCVAMGILILWVVLQ
jgi:hypothetical protein